MINQERWFSLNYVDQMAHIGSEIERASYWEAKSDRTSRNHCLERALDLIDLTKNDSRLNGRRKELCYLRELVADQYANTSVYDVTLESIDQYCTEFALIARKAF